MTKKSPYFTIWFNPSKSLNEVLTGQTSFNYHIPIFLSTISLFLGQLSYNMDLGLMFSILIFVVSCVIGYLLLTTLLPWLLISVGKIWNGKSGRKEMLIVIGLAQIPSLLTLAEQLIFLSLGEILSDSNVNILLQWIVWIFYLRILIIGISKVQGFSYTFALLNLVISVIPFIILKLVL